MDVQVPSLFTLRWCAVILAPDHTLGVAHGFAAAPARWALDNVSIFILEQKEPFLRISIARPCRDADGQGSPGGIPIPAQESRVRHREIGLARDNKPRREPYEVGEIQAPLRRDFERPTPTILQVCSLVKWRLFALGGGQI